jgi:hypothetical protein
VLLADVMIDTVNAALEDREITLNGVGVCVAPDVFLDRMVDGFVAGEALADLRIYRALIGAEVRFFGDCVNQDRL